MKAVKLTPKASQDLEDIWFYGYHQFGEEQADKYINHISDIFRILGENNIGTPRPELGEYINALPFERHIIYFRKLIPILFLSVYYASIRMLVVISTGTNS